MKISSYIFSKYLNSIIKMDKKLLGRWELKKENPETISVFWTNNDHCGNCGNLIENKKLLDEKLSKVKKA